ncbi:hybrid sensor histidine kinase/response regulator [Terasakiella sp. SH-1]|uniref:hybrid sensor histidine kinase/response regulator n=1 Tax=Terasakiella sp. SH-1 TaxID=2560057 RepID=UPI0010737B20|nr:hybrid sensor histidine kinase/response regulator [Terasakiella sp. SH-1]
MRKRFSSISSWVLLGLFVSVALPLGFAEWFLIRQHETQRYAQFREQGQLMADNIALAMSYPIEIFDPSRGSIVLELPKKNPQISEIQVYDTFNDLPFLHYRVPDREIGNRYEFKAIALNAKGEEVGRVLAVYNDSALQAEILERQRLLEVVFLLTSLFLLAIMLPLLFIKVLQPLRRLTAQASDFRDNKLEETVFWKGSDEISTLGQTLEIARVSIVDLVTKLQEKKKEAEKANNAKSEFLATMSHEIRTPMTGVVSMAELLQKSGLNRDQDKMVGTIRRSAKNLRKIIDAILDVSKAEANQIILEIEDTCLRDVIEDVGHTLGMEAEDKEIDFQLYIDPAIPKQLECDALRLRQILLNLASNGIKFTPRGGRLRIEAELEQKKADGKYDIRFVVEDNGIGISEETQDKLFQPFAQAEISTTRKYGGTGLGLYICRQLVALMGGNIELHSKLEEGSRFYFTLELNGKTGDEVHEEECHDFSGQSFCFISREASREKGVKEYLEYWGGTVSFCDKPEALKGDALLIDGLGGNLAEFQKYCSLGIPTLVIGLDKPQEAPALESNVRYFKETPLTRSGLLCAVGQLTGRFEKSETKGINSEKASLSFSLENAEQDEKRVLIAEDDPVNQEVFARQLRWLGYSVDVVSNGEEALRAIERKHYGMMFTDMHMPDCDGYELVTRLRELEKQKGEAMTSLPVFVITAATSDIHSPRFNGLDIQGVLLKPVELDELQQIMAQWPPHEKNRGEKVSSLIDLAVLKEFFGPTDDHIQDVLALFVESSQAVMDGLTQAYQEKNLRQVGELSHKLHSASASIRCKSLADLCLQAEESSNHHDWDRLDSLFPEIQKRYEQVLSFIEQDRP